MRIIIAIFSCLLFIESAIAQNEASGEFWIGPEVNIETSDDITISGAIESRSSNTDVQLINSFFSELGASYQLVKFLRVKGNLRYYFHDNPGPRFNIDLTARGKKKPFIVSWRGRYQTSYQEIKFNENRGFYGRGTRIRNKISLKLDLDMAVTPYTGIDFFYALGGGNAFEVNDKGYDGLRFSAGLEYGFENDHELKVGYNYEAPGYGSPFKSHIVAIYYTINFNKPKKKDKEG